MQETDERWNPICFLLGRIYMDKRLYRSRESRMIAGVCGGLGEYFDMDPTIVRLIVVAAALAAGGGILAYILAWIIVPERPAGL